MTGLGFPLRQYSVIFIHRWIKIHKIRQDHKKQRQELAQSRARGELPRWQGLYCRRNTIIHLKEDVSPIVEGLKTYIRVYIRTRVCVWSVWDHHSNQWCRSTRRKPTETNDADESKRNSKHISTGIIHTRSEEFTQPPITDHRPIKRSLAITGIIATSHWKEQHLQEVLHKEEWVLQLLNARREKSDFFF